MRERERECVCMFVGKNHKTNSHVKIYILSGLTYLQMCTALVEPPPVKNSVAETQSELHNKTTSQQISCF